MCSSIMARGVVLEAMRPIENFQFLGKNANILQQFFFHSISVRNGITKTAKDWKMHRVLVGIIGTLQREATCLTFLSSDNDSASFNARDD